MRIKSFLLGFLLVCFFMILIPLLLIYINNRLSLPVYGSHLLKAVGILLILVGTLIDISCTHLFKKTGKGTPVPIEATKELVIEGLYKYSRNPMYLAVFMIFLGEFFLFGHLLLLFYFLISMPVLHFCVVYIEEPELKRKFGKSYIEYTKKVPRWLPKVKF